MVARAPKFRRTKPPLLAAALALARERRETTGNHSFNAEHARKLST
jgi:hypothetical protein